MPSWTPFKNFVPDDALTPLRCKLSDPRFLDNIDDTAWEYGIQSGVSSAYYHAVVVARSGTDRTLRALPYCPTQARVSIRKPVLYIHTDVRAASTTPTLPRKRAHPPSRHPRPGLPTPPTRLQMQTPRTLRRPRSAKVEEVHRSRTLPCSAASAVDLRVYAHEGGGVGGVGDDRRSMMRHSVSGLSGGTGPSPAADACEIVQHHDGGLSARIDSRHPITNVWASSRILHPLDI